MMMMRRIRQIWSAGIYSRFLSAIHRRFRQTVPRGLFAAGAAIESGNEFPHSKFAFLIAVLPAGIGVEAFASALIGAAIVVLAWWTFHVLESDDLEQGAEWRV